MKNEEIPFHASEMLDLSAAIAREQLSTAERLVGAHFSTLIGTSRGSEATIALAHILATNYLALATERGLSMRGRNRPPVRFSRGGVE